MKPPLKGSQAGRMGPFWPRSSAQSSSSIKVEGRRGSRASASSLGMGTPVGSSSSQAGRSQSRSWAVTIISPIQISPGCGSSSSGIGGASGQTGEGWAGREGAKGAHCRAFHNLQGERPPAPTGCPHDSCPLLAAHHRNAAFPTCSSTLRTARAEARVTKPRASRGATLAGCCTPMSLNPCLFNTWKCACREERKK